MRQRRLLELIRTPWLQEFEVNQPRSRLQLSEFRAEQRQFLEITVSENFCIFVS